MDLGSANISGVLRLMAGAAFQNFMWSKCGPTVLFPSICELSWSNYDVVSLFEPLQLEHQSHVSFRNGRSRNFDSSAWVQDTSKPRTNDRNFWECRLFFQAFSSLYVNHAKKTKATALQAVIQYMLLFKHISLVVLHWNLGVFLDPDVSSSTTHLVFHNCIQSVNTWIL